MAATTKTSFEGDEYTLRTLLKPPAYDSLSQGSLYITLHYGEHIFLVLSSRPAFSGLISKSWTLSCCLQALSSLMFQLYMK